MLKLLHILPDADRYTELQVAQRPGVCEIVWYLHGWRLVDHLLAHVHNDAREYSEAIVVDLYNVTHTPDICDSIPVQLGVFHFSAYSKRQGISDCQVNVETKIDHVEANHDAT